MKAKHGGDPEKWEEESYDSENGSEDSEGDLLTSKAEMKFASLLDRIKKKDKTLLDGDGEYFKESDFEENESENSSGDKKKSKKDKKAKKEKKDKKSSKKKTLKDVIREDALKRIENDESAGGSSDESDDRGIFSRAGGRKGETMAEEQERLKNEFKSKAGVNEKSSEASSRGGEFNSDDDILIKKEKVSDSSDSSEDNDD